jgi:hypothetical protein
MTQPDGRARKTRTTFRMECAVAIRIAAPPEKIWALLTDAEGFPAWNSTVTSVAGPIALGQKLTLRVPSAPKQTFTPRVSELEAPTRMVWRDGFAPMFQGVRTFEISRAGEGATEFSMVEVFSGLMLPMIAGSLPDFEPIFQQYAADLKRAAEQA